MLNDLLAWVLDTIQALDPTLRVVITGVAELEAGAEPLGRVRRPGAGRKPITETDPGIVEALLALVEPTRRGDPVISVEHIEVFRMESVRASIIERPRSIFPTPLRPTCLLPQIRRAGFS